MATTEPIRDRKQLQALAHYYLEQGQVRNYAMLMTGVYTALRIGDLLQLKWNDVYDEEKEAFHNHITLTEQKTGKTKTIALNNQAAEALRLCLPFRKCEYIFASRNGGNRPISRMQAWRVIRGACMALGIDGNISCHSLRKTWGYHA